MDSPRAVSKTIDSFEYSIITTMWVMLLGAKAFHVSEVVLHALFVQQSFAHAGQLLRLDLALAH